ncbi:MAG: magnesium chelatase domain-containing protein, partial [Acidimicrobiia bacterium]|nr:magnesium chelatase domain-containing protein [Acidimicrobiia bacterium]
EGRRSILVEVQALVTPTRQPQPRRSVRGIEATRVHQVLAVLERHCGVSLAEKEVYVNVVGGWRLAEPAADLAVALAVASSETDIALGSTAAWGEIGLAGEVRSVPFAERRRAESERSGIRRMLVAEPRSNTRLDVVLAAAGLTPAG